MRPKIADTVPQEDWELFAKVAAAIEGLPKHISAPTYLFGLRLSREVARSKLIPNCHVVTRALAKFLDVDVHDGYVVERQWDGTFKYHEHSWLTRKGTDGKIVIDPWPLGVVTGPAIFIQDYAFHFGHECSFLAHRTREFASEVAATRLALRKVFKRRNIPMKAAA